MKYELKIFQHNMNAMKMEHHAHMHPHTTSSLNMEDANKVDEVTFVSSILNVIKKEKKRKKMNLR
jgi:hypothetical protein